MKSRKVWLFISLVFLTALSLNISCSRQQISDAEIEQKIQAMTLEEKIDFIGGYKQFNIRGMERLGIPETHMADGPVGVRNFGKSTAYPAGINLAASWDRDMARRIGASIGMEARSKNAHFMLGPAMNIYRLPLCGRNFEYLGEDPYLAGQLAKEYTLGMQAQGVMATAKHYDANNQEFDRHHTSSDMDERTLHEIYLPAFKATVQEGKAAAVMTSYNLINGVHASQNQYLNNEILKGRWGFEGLIMSDWVSTYDGLACALGGLDLEMPSGAMMNKETLIPAVKNGDLPESVIDDKIRRILRMYNRFGLFKRPDISEGYTLDSAAVRQTALDAARGGMVLLKNEGQILPLKRNAVRTIAVVGPNGSPAVTGGGGSSFVRPLHAISLAEAVKQSAGEGIEVVFQKGIATGGSLPDGFFKSFNGYVYQDGRKVPGVEAVFYADKKCKGKVIHSGIIDKLDLTDDDMWDLTNVPETDYSARFTCYYIPDSSGYYAIGGRGDDGYKIRLNDKEIISMWRDQGPAVSKYNTWLDGGKEYKLQVDYYQSGGGAVIQLGVQKIDGFIQADQYERLAVEAAAKADIVIVAAGFTNEDESEGFDRTFELPRQQSAFINKIAAVNDHVVVVLNAGGNVEMESWIGNVKGLLMAWYPGGEGNLAAAEILFGDTNPSGRLPASFAMDITENPAFPHYFDEDGDKRVFYGEGIFLGYRYWDQTDKKPRFPFGFGLSYTTFEFSPLSTDKTEYAVGEPVKITLKVKNTGDRSGAEVVQLYVSDTKCSLPRPVRELKDFAKVQLAAGEEKTVTFTLNEDAFSFYNSAIHDWQVEPGEFEICAGASSADVRQTAVIQIQ